MTTSQEHLWKKIQITYNHITKPQKLYTGTSIKRYIRQKVFALKNTPFQNPALASGRWTAYCHFSPLLAFRNLLSKYELDSSKTVLVHPLFPAPLVEELLQTRCKILTMDITKDNLDFPPTQFKNYINFLKSHTLPDLILHYDCNGLYQDIVTLLNTSQELSIPSLILIDNPKINQELLQVFDSHRLGSLIWNYGQSFWDEQLNIVLPTKLPSKTWYLSWHIETRTRSILEYHLSHSQDEFSPVLESYFYLLLQAYAKLTYKGLPLPFLANLVVFKSKFNSTSQAQNTLIQAYPKTLLAAIPDIVFDLQLESQETYEDKPQDLAHQDLIFRQQARQLFEFFNHQVPSRPPGTLEIPNFYPNKTYLQFIYYTTEKAYWLNFLIKQGLNPQPFTEIHPAILNQSNKLPNAVFIQQYGIKLDISQSIHKHFPS